MHTISSYHGNRSTNTHTHPWTGPITIHCAAASAQCMVIRAEAVRASAHKELFNSVDFLHFFSSFSTILRESFLDRIRARSQQHVFYNGGDTF